MTLYDGIGNPLDHVINYKTFMELQTHFNALLCKAWFHSLKQGTIKSFLDLANAFMGRFIASVPALHKTNKTLREYVDLFNTEALQIPNLDKPRAIEAILSRKRLITLAELIQWAEKYIYPDDALATSKFVREERERHHKEHRKSSIDSVIKRGHLKKFVKKEGAPTRVEEKGGRENSSMPINDGSSRIIHMIVGGPPSDIKKRKKRKIEQKTKEPEVMQVNSWGIKAPHDDVLVIEAIIHNFKF
ncbi:hypothetical protein P3X46_032249 [Hevea brasiliensis]|uniref:Retrotransposon gag domain-containing protein n=1 Tax=Hevea brasiliensis TaxID=3981 RepID=A0ABQ9KCP7_HEVBR|nr:hypothetical protein P3X46_032249 [Hevea brasiliensis]